MEQGGEEGRVCSYLDMGNTHEGFVQHVDKIVLSMIDENYSRREAVERLVQPGVRASSFGAYGNHNAISTIQQEQNNEVDSLILDGARIQEPNIYAKSWEEIAQWLMSDGIENGIGGVVQPAYTEELHCTPPGAPRVKELLVASGLEHVEEDKLHHLPVGDSTRHCNMEKTLVPLREEGVLILQQQIDVLRTQLSQAQAELALLQVMQTTTSSNLGIVLLPQAHEVSKEAPTVAATLLLISPRHYNHYMLDCSSTLDCMYTNMLFYEQQQEHWKKELQRSRTIGA
ncbi:hypothetical protein SADUNF_Sadunf19G0020000 [Salix dunnii]|nr:hypothetical protein SADUNF_Sadunf19G0020000 [Salix dunnii]